MSLILNGTTGISDVDGTAAAPALTGTDSNTGIFFPAADQVAISTGGTQRAVVDASGNVGIGTSSPADKLHVVGTVKIEGSTLDLNDAGTFTISQNTTASALVLRTAASSYLRFDTNGANERARIDSNGTLLVGCTGGGISGNAIVSFGSGSDIQKLFSTGASSPSLSLFAMFSNATTPSAPTGTLRVNILTNGGISNFSANNVNLSDRREKTNFAPAKSYLDVICAIPVQTFNYIDQNMEEDAGLTLGVVAQDVQAVAPEMVMESNWGTQEAPKMRLSIYQTDLQYALMKCIQEQQALITALTTRITALEGTS